MKLLYLRLHLYFNAQDSLQMDSFISLSLSKSAAVTFINTFLILTGIIFSVKDIDVQ